MSEQTPFFRLRLHPDTAREVEQALHGMDVSLLSRIRRFLKFAEQYGCYSFGRLAPVDIRAQPLPNATLQRTCEAIAATQQPFDFRPICYVVHPMVDPLLHCHSAALLSRDGRFGLAVTHYRRERDDDLFYSCTSALDDGTFAVTLHAPPTPLDPPVYRVERAPASLKELLAHHAGRLAALPVRAFAAERVPQVLLELDAALFEHNIKLGRFVPLSVDDLRKVRLALTGD
jgi:hypothetical protein